MHRVERQHSSQLAGAAEEVQRTHRRVDVAVVVGSFLGRVGEISVWRSVLAALLHLALVPADRAALHRVVRCVDGAHDATDNLVKVLADVSEDGDVVEEVSGRASRSSVRVCSVEDDVLLSVDPVVLGGELDQYFLMNKLRDRHDVTVHEHDPLASISVFNEEGSSVEPTENTGITLL